MCEFELDNKCLRTIMQKFESKNIICSTKKQQSIIINIRNNIIDLATTTTTTTTSTSNTTNPNSGYIYGQPSTDNFNNNNNNNNDSGFCKLPSIKHTIERLNKLNSISLSRKAVLQELFDYWKNDEKKIVLITGIINRKSDIDGLDVSILKIQKIRPNEPIADSPPSDSLLHYLSKLQLEARCPLVEFNHNLCKEFTYFQPGSTMKALIQSIDLDNEEIILTLDSSIFINKSLEYFKHFQLGIFQSNSDDFVSSFELNTILENDKQLTNPWSYANMLQSLGLSESDSTFLPRDLSSTTKQLDYKSLRDHQNYEWARDMVVKGIEYAKKGQFDRALDLYYSALEADKDHSDAYVALGAAYANTAKYDRALSNFKKALELVPNDKNAEKYYNATLQRKLQEDKIEEDKRIEKQRLIIEKEKEREREKKKERELNEMISTEKLKNMLMNIDEKKKKDDKHKSKEKRDRDRDRDRDREKDKDKDKDKYKSKDKDRDRDRDRKRDKDRDRDRSNSRSRERERGRDRKRDKDRDRSNSRSRSRDRDRKYKDKDRDRDRDRSNSRSRDNKRSKY
ncbi:hypothetical protein PPL_01984 [Heterostelium album PN500]|uniref:Uncharacterized protein n=1 Tax=Heterostelium pallidum (strain ATCC 26659 / Pp 5 / PN500) TaxID=670386 RepID=D3B116_HETP5|nr:hypothetical protein PPL_01984 [Heterostelium album PN500]EFA84990.1 hypothetical protein PPL_01984 [Heterostelium album PN500]|eukprot:XP_020437100.1 hypothetical protein PPL_01984 [Heterostelium album PN500]